MLLHNVTVKFNLAVKLLNMVTLITFLNHLSQSINFAGKDRSVVFWSIQDHLSATIQPLIPQLTNLQYLECQSPKQMEKALVLVHVVSSKATTTLLKMSNSVQKAHRSSVVSEMILALYCVKVEKAHDADLHCVDWSPFDENYILTGSADNSVRMFDRRSLTSGGIGSPLYKFEGHTSAVLCVQWSPDNPTVFGSAAEDGLLNIWNYAKVGEKEEQDQDNSDLVPGLLFQHAGHRDKVVDFHWNAYDPWTIVSVSDDCDTSGGGGTLQIWRMTDLLYRPRDEVLAELYEFKSHVSNCAPQP